MLERNDRRGEYANMMTYKREQEGALTPTGREGSDTHYENN